MIDRKKSVVVIDGTAIPECDEIFDQLAEGKLTYAHTQWIRERVRSYDTQPVILLLRVIRETLADPEVISPVSQAAFARAEVVITQAMLCANDVDALSAYFDATFPLGTTPTKINHAFIRQLAAVIARNLGAESVVSIIEIYSEWKPHDSLILHWIHELTFSTPNIEDYFAISKFVKAMKSRETTSPLASIPLSVHPMESHIRLPSEDSNSVVYYLPYGPIGFPPRFRSSRSSTPIASSKIQRLITGTKETTNGWMRGVVGEALSQLRNPSIEFRVYENNSKDVLFDQDCLIPHFLSQIEIESLAGITDLTLQARRIEPGHATRILFTLVAYGTRGESEHQISYGRYLLRRLMSVVVGSTTDIMNQIENFKWFYLEADLPWFHKSSCDVILVAIRKDGRFMSYLAVSEPAIAQSTLINLRGKIQVSGPLHHSEPDGLTGKSVIRIVDNDFLRQAPFVWQQ